MSNIITIKNVRAYVDEKGTAQINLEDAARGLGFSRETNGKEYVRWETVAGYLEEFGFCQLVGKNNGKTIQEQLPEYIPENIFYRLAMKAKNETAEKFQIMVADEILPSIRKTGKYVSPGAAEKESAYLRNAKTRQAKLMQQMAKDFAGILCSESIQILVAESAQLLVGRPVLPKPQIDVHFTATQIAEEFGTSANQVGRISNKCNLKNTENGRWVLDKAKGHDKQVQTFLYNAKGRQAVIDALRAAGKEGGERTLEICK